MAAGAFNNDAGQNAITFFIGGITQTIPTVLFTSKTDVNVNNTVTETSLLPAGSGLIPGVAPQFNANYWKPGKVFEYYMCGLYSTSGTPTLQFRTFMGASAVVSSGAQTTASNMANRFWEERGTIECRTTGASGTFVVQGVARVKTTATDSTPEWEMTTNGTVTADTTGPLTFDNKVTWGTASTSNSITATTEYGHFLN